MGVISADGLYTGHPDFADVCVGYDVELCCDCCGAECDSRDLYKYDGEMYCADCILENELTYNCEEEPAYYDDEKTVIDCCLCCGCNDRQLYEVEGDEGERLVYCGACLLSERYEKITDRDIDVALSRFFDRF